MDVHFVDSCLIKTPSPEINHLQYEFPIQHVTMAGNGMNSYRLPGAESSMKRADWRQRDVSANNNEIVQQTFPCTISETQQSNESNNSEILKLCVFQGEVCPTRLQRAEIIIPTINGAITQPVILLPLKRREQFVESSKEIGVFETFSGQKTQVPEKSPSIKLQNTNSAMKIPRIKQEKVERNILRRSLMKEETSPFAFNRAPAPTRNSPAVLNKRLMIETLKQQKVSRAKQTQQSANKPNNTRFENPQPIISMPSLSPNTFWQSQPRLPQWLTGIDQIDMNSLPDPLNL